MATTTTAKRTAPGIRKRHQKACASYLLAAEEDADGEQLGRSDADDLFTEVEAAWNVLFPDRPALADIAHSRT